MIPLSRSRRKNGGGQYKNLISFFNRKRQKTIGIFVFILFVLCMIVLNTSYPMRNTERTSTSTRRKYDFKIFVYDLPPWANKMILERDPECRNSVFATEIVIHEQIMRNSHGILTRNPDEADFFFVPVYAACLVYKDFGLFEKYRFIVKSVLDFVMKKPYWHRSGGRDHIWPLVHDFGACLSWLDNNDRVYFPEMHSSIFLSHLGDLNMGCFQTHRDVVIPPYISSPRIRTLYSSVEFENTFL